MVAVRKPFATRMAETARRLAGKVRTTFSFSRTSAIPIVESTPQLFFLRAIEGPAAGRIFSLNRDKASMGSFKGYTVHLPEVRGTAAVIRRDATGYVIHPGASGAKLNEAALAAPSRLAVGDSIRVGRHLFEVVARRPTVEPSLQPFFLKAVDGPAAGRIFSLHRARVSIGEFKGYTVRLPDVRGTAAVIYRDASGYVIHPGASGAKLNEAALAAPSRLAVGDSIRVGRHLFEVVARRPTISTEPNPFSHVLIIPTMNRPEKLRSLLSSMVENTKLFGYTGKVKVVMVDDSGEEASKANKETINEFKAKAGAQFSFHYYDKADQGRLVEYMRDKLAQQDISPDEFVFEKPGQKGYGGVRNIASLLALKHIDPNDIVTFLDDDVSLKNLMVEKNGRLRAKHVQSYFHALDSAFSKPNVNVVGGDYTGDAGGAAFHHLSAGLDYLNYFFSHAGQHSPGASASNALRPLWKAAPPNVRTVNTSFQRGVSMMSNLSEQLSRGRFRFTLGLFPFGKQMGRKSFHVAGNLSMRANALTSLPFPMLGGWARGEDVIWSSTFDRLNGGVYYVPNPVLHLKDLNGRRIVSDAVRDMPCHTVISVLREALSQNNNLQQAANVITDEQVQRHLAPQKLKYKKTIAAWQEKTHELRIALASGWWNTGATRRDVEKIRDTLGKVESGFAPALRDVEEVLESSKVAGAIKKFGKLSVNWPQVCSIARGFE